MRVRDWKRKLVALLGSKARRKSEDVTPLAQAPSRRSNAAPQSPITRSEVDARAAEAADLALCEGATPRTMTALQEALEAARAVLAAGGGSDDRRRLSMLRWRQAAVLAAGGDTQAALAPCREAIALARQVLQETPADDHDFDAIVGEFGTRANDLSRLLLAAGIPDEARKLLDESDQATQRSEGPAAKRARAGTMFVMVNTLADEVFEARREGRKSEADPSVAIASALSLVQMRRSIATEDDPTTLFDLAESLEVLATLYAVVPQPQSAMDAFSEAYFIFSRFSGPAAKERTELMLKHMGRLGKAFPGLRVRMHLPGR